MSSNTRGQELSNQIWKTMLIESKIQTLRRKYNSGEIDLMEFARKLRTAEQDTKW